MVPTQHTEQLHTTGEYAPDQARAASVHPCMDCRVILCRTLTERLAQL